MGGVFQLVDNLYDTGCIWRIFFNNCLNIRLFLIKFA